LAEKAIVVAEMAADEAFAVPAGFAVLDERTYGDTKVVVLSVAP
jgi:16S rRNA G966 N2-methylase RsmD